MRETMKGNPDVEAHCRLSIVDCRLGEPRQFARLACDLRRDKSTIENHQSTIPPSALALLLVLLLAAPAANGQVKHPYILWSKDEIVPIRKRVLAEPWAKKRFQEMFVDANDPARRSTVDNLLLYMLVGDKSIIPAEKKPMDDFVVAHPSVRDQTDWRWHHMDRWLHAIRYDVLHDELTPSERKGLEYALRENALWAVKEERIRWWDGNPRMASGSFCALALGDKRLIRGVFECTGGLKDFLDSLTDGYYPRGAGNPSYRTLGQLLIWCRAVRRLGMNDIGFGYVGKDGGTVRKLLEGLLRFGDGRVDIPGGMPFYGRTAAVHTWSADHVGYSMPTHRGLEDLFAAPIVSGWLPDGMGGCPAWSAACPKAFDMFENGGARLLPPGILELAHAEWPDAGFDYFLARMREPSQDRYYPTLHWGLEPIDPKAVKTPAGNRSAVLSGCGLAVLRAEETPAFWESPAPTVALNFGSGGRGAVGGQFALLGFSAFNRPLYRFVRSAGPLSPEHAWSTSARSHSTVAVDNMVLGRVVEQGLYVMRPVWPGSVARVPARHAFDELVKFVGIRAKPHAEQLTDANGTVTGTAMRQVYPGVDFERCLMLTRQYLFDVFAVRGDKPHTYHWLVHAFGAGRPDDPARWQSTEELNDTLGDVRKPSIWNFEDQRRLDAGQAAWAITALQTPARSEPNSGRLGRAWYDRKVGVRLTMLGGQPTVAYYARTPGTTGKISIDRVGPLRTDKFALPARSRDYDSADKEITEVKILPRGKKAPPKEPAEQKPQAPQYRIRTGPADETGGVSVIAARQCANTVFAVVHEPFVGGKWKINEIRRIAGDDGALAVAVVGEQGSGVDDRLLLRLGDEAGKPVRLAGDGEAFTFADRAFVRVAPDAVRACGDLRAMRLKVGGSPRLILNGKQQEASVANGVMAFGQE